MRKRCLFSLVCAGLLSGCHAGGDGHDADVSCRFSRVDSFLTVYDGLSPDCREAFAADFSDGLAVYAGMMGVDAPTPDSAAARLAVLPAVRVFGPDVLSRLTAVDSLESVVGRVEESLSERLPGVVDGEVVTVVSPYRQSIVVADSMVVIALNHYLGADYPGYASIEEYQRRLKTPRHLPYDFAEAIVAVNRPFDGDAPATVLDRMLYEGALVAAVMELVPDADLAEALGYTPAQLRWALDNERLVWQTIVGENLLYSTSDFDAARLLAPAPSTPVVNSMAPGRLGRFVGYRIVRRLMDSDGGVSIDRLLSPATYRDGQKTLLKSGYAP